MAGSKSAVKSPIQSTVVIVCRNEYKRGTALQSQRLEIKFTHDEPSEHNADSPPWCEIQLHAISQRHALIYFLHYDDNNYASDIVLLVIKKS